MLLVKRIDIARFVLECSYACLCVFNTILCVYAIYLLSFYVLAASVFCCLHVSKCASVFARVCVLSSLKLARLVLPIFSLCLSPPRFYARGARLAKIIIIMRSYLYFYFCFYFMCMFSIYKICKLALT